MKKFTLIPWLTLLLTGIITNCDMPETEVHVSQDFMTHVAQVSFVTDASNEAAGKLLEELNEVKVNLDGPDKDKVYNIEGRKDDFKIQGGRLHLLLSPNELTTDTESRTVNVIVDIPGYLKRNVPVTFIKGINNGFVEVALIKETNLPQGIKLAEDKTGKIDPVTGLDKTISIKASNDDVGGVTTEISIPAEVKMFGKNAKGEKEPLSGNLEAKVISFTDNGDLTAYFPGGLMPTNIDMGDGTTRDGAFVSAGFAAINMKVNGKTVKTFEGGEVEVKMTLGKTTYNPATGLPFKKDDTIDIWSYDDDKGQWKFEKTGIVQEDTNGSLYVAFTTKHLSYFNLDYLASGDGGRCFFANLKIKWTGVTTENKIRARFVFTYLGTGTSPWTQRVMTTEGEVYNDANIYIYNAPRLPIQIEVYDIDNGKSLAKKTFANGALCNGNAEISITAPAPVIELVSLTYKGMCSGTRIYPPVGTLVYYKPAGGNWQIFHYVDYAKRFDTKIVTNKLKMNETYDFRIYAGGKFQERTNIVITKAVHDIEVKLPDDICKSLAR